MTIVAAATPVVACRIAPLAPSDRDAWERLARGYHDFYRESFSAGAYDATWQRLLDGRVIVGVGAHAGGRLVGIAHYLFHEHVWREQVCYLQDLYVDENVRRAGVGRALIDHVAGAARGRGAFRLYWSTGFDNTTARRLYDKVATVMPYVRYDRSLS